jgi:hypothetical protein
MYDIEHFGQLYTTCSSYCMYVHTYMTCSTTAQYFLILYIYSFPTPRTTILRPIFYCCDSFDRVSTMFYINRGLFTLTVFSTRTKKLTMYKWVAAPSHPRATAHFCASQLRPHTPKRNGVGRHSTTTSVTGILTQCIVCSTYPNYRPFWHL